MSPNQHKAKRVFPPAQSLWNVLAKLKAIIQTQNANVEGDNDKTDRQLPGLDLSCLSQEHKRDSSLQFKPRSLTNLQPVSIYSVYKSDVWQPASSAIPASLGTLLDFSPMHSVITGTGGERKRVYLKQKGSCMLSGQGVWVCAPTYTILLFRILRRD